MEVETRTLTELLGVAEARTNQIARWIAIAQKRIGWAKGAGEKKRAHHLSVARLYARSARDALGETEKK